MDAYKNRINQLRAERKYEEALKVILDEEQERPSAAEVLSDKTAALGLLDKYEEAVQAADQAIAVDPNNHWVHHMKGISLCSLGRYKEAVNAFDTCLNIQPNFGRAAGKKISALIYLEKYQEAVQLFEKSDIPENVGEDVQLNNIGFMYIEAGDLVKAKPYLLRAKALNPFQKVVYYNLARLSKELDERWSHFKYKFSFSLLNLAEKSKTIKRAIENYSSGLGISRTKDEGAEFYGGSGRLFLGDRQSRETRSILKLLRDVNATALCNDSWQWFGVNIPYQAIERNGIEGDIDIILKRPRYFIERDGGFTYRGFEVKAVIVDRFGKIKSAKRSKSDYRKIVQQLDKLRNFGCEQIFLLELYVLERGYSSKNRFPSKDIAKEIHRKRKLLEGLGYGYVVFAEEPSTTHDDESGGMLHVPINVLSATSNSVGYNFQKLADSIDSFLGEEPTKKFVDNLSNQDNFGTKVGYCTVCKKLTMIYPVGLTSHSCAWCDEPYY